MTHGKIIHLLTAGLHVHLKKTLVFCVCVFLILGKSSETWPQACGLRFSTTPPRSATGCQEKRWSQNSKGSIDVRVATEQKELEGFKRRLFENLLLSNSQAEEEFNKAQNVFEEINNELREELPVLYQRYAAPVDRGIRVEIWIMIWQDYADSTISAQIRRLIIQD